MDRPDLDSSVQLMSASFRGSAATGAFARASTPEPGQRPSSNSSSAMRYAADDSVTPIATTGTAGQRTMVRRAVAGATVITTAPGGTAGGSSLHGGPLATPKNMDRPDLASSMELMAPAWRGSAQSVPLHNLGATSPLPQTPASGARPGSAQRRPITPLQELAAGQTFTEGSPKLDAVESSSPATLATPTNADRKIMMARSRNSARSNVLAARFGAEGGK